MFYSLFRKQKNTRTCEDIPENSRRISERFCFTVDIIQVLYDEDDYKISEIEGQEPHVTFQGRKLNFQSKRSVHVHLCISPQGVGPLAAFDRDQNFPVKPQQLHDIFSFIIRNDPHSCTVTAFCTRTCIFFIIRSDRLSRRVQVYRKFSRPNHFPIGKICRGLIIRGLFPRPLKFAQLMRKTGIKTFQ